MTDETDIPLAVEQVECSPLGLSKVQVRVTGRWRGRGRAPDARAFLVIETDGHRHRFPAMPEPPRPRLSRSGPWGASFALPSWLEPRLGEQTSLWLGSLEIPLLSITVASESSMAASDPTASSAAPDDRGDDVAEPTGRWRPASGEGSPTRASTEGDDATIAALRGELAQRAATEAQLRGALVGAKAEVESRTAHQTELESIQAELRIELGQLLSLVEQEGAKRAAVESRSLILSAEVGSLEDQIAELTASRDQVAAETCKLHQQLDRAATEAGELRDELVALRNDAKHQDAERVLLTVRSKELYEELEGLRAELAESAVAREATAAEAAGLRDELDRLGAELGEARRPNSNHAELSEAQSLLLDARAATARLRDGDDGDDG